MLCVLCCYNGRWAERARRKVIEELMSVSVSHNNAQRVWLRITGVGLLAVALQTSISPLTRLNIA